MKTNRRNFLLGLGGGGAMLALGALRRQGPTPLPTDVPLIDFHAHLFGVGDSDSGCFLHDKQRRHWTFDYLKRLLGIHEPERQNDESVDAQLVRRLVEHVGASSVDRVVLQAWDGRYTNGKLDLESTTSLYVPNRYLFKVVAQHPELFIPCASINPKRSDALEELEYCAEQGALMVKMHPPTMDVDPSNPAFLPFYRLCRERNIILMVHTGMEHAADIVGLENCDPQKLVPALELGCTVVAAHAGYGQFHDREDFYPSFERLVQQYSNLYGDSSILGSMMRWRNIPRLLDHPIALSRMIFGTDYPFASNALVFWNRLSPATLLALCAERNLFERDLQLKRHLGFPASHFRLGAQLLGLTSKG
jgi:predicted TIM-barrel fold metal-dependent hydrolase